MITAPYTWTPARVQSPWADPAPAGLWWTDFTDGAYVAGVTMVRRALPYWGALDFGYTRDRKLLMLVAGPHDNGLSAVLRVYRFDGDPNALTSAGYAEVEPSGVSGAAMLVRGSTEVDVFYTKAGVLYHSLSDDGGETFAPPVSISLTSSAAAAFTPATAAYVGGSSAVDTAAHARGGFVAVEKLTGGGMALLAHGRLAGAGTDETHIVRADWDGAAWSFGSIARVQVGGASQGTISGLQALRNGDCVWFPAARQFTKLQRDGTYTVRNNAAGTPTVGSNAQTGLDESLNQYMRWMHNPGFFTDGSGEYGNLLPFGYRYVVATPVWDLIGATSLALTNARVAAGEALQEWVATLPLSAAFPNSTLVKSSAGKARVNRDRRWEVLFMSRDELPTLARYALMPAQGDGLALV